MEKISIIKNEVEELIKKIVNQYEIDIEDKDGRYMVLIKTEEAATLIGRYGETIRAIQKIIEVILYKKFQSPIQILVNVNDYREKQKEKLETLARKIAEEVKKEKKQAALGKLSSFERKIIHEFISKNYPELESHSEGEGKERKLIIQTKSS